MHMNQQKGLIISGRARHRRGAVRGGGLFVAMCVLLGGGSCAKRAEEAESSQAPPNRPNIILITVESLRTDHLSCYGYDRDTCPTLDALAREATLYENAHSVTSWTLTSHASIFTGLYPTAHRTVRPKSKLSPTYQTMAEILADYDYQTAAIVSGPYLKKAFGLNQGFQTYDTSPLSPPKVNAHNDITNPRMEAGVNRFLDKVRRKNRPFFLFLYYWDPHYQFIPPPPYDKKFVPPDAKPVKNPQFHIAYKLGKHITRPQVKYLEAEYDGEICCTDGYLGRFFERLKQLGLWENTAVIVTADHGEQFYDHGHLGHKYDLHVESLHVPLVVKYPEQTEPRRDGRLVSLIDLFPTVLDLGRCRHPRTEQGRSLLADPRPAEEPIFHELISIWYLKRKSTGERWTETETWDAIRQGDYKLIRQQQAGVDQLYNVVQDPRELHPLTTGQEERLAQFRRQLDEHYQAMQAVADLISQGGGRAIISPEEEQRLRSLGYVQ